MIGRYYAMDRDRRWERVQLAYDLLVHGKAEHRADSAAQALRDAYARDETDEFVRPVAIGAEARIRPGDSVFAFNFRPDRMREITRALAEDGFADVDRGGARGARPLRDDDRVRGGLDVPGRLPAGAPRGHAAAGDRRLRRRASCTSPRPRSIRT